jgi:hypothetical protein
MRNSWPTACFLRQSMIVVKHKSISGFYFEFDTDGGLQYLSLRSTSPKGRGS